MDESNKDQKPKKDSENDKKLREMEQTQKLLIGLTEELFNKMEKQNEINENLKNPEQDNLEEISEVDKKKSKKKKTTIEFTDLSWYKEKLKNSEQE